MREKIAGRHSMVGDHVQLHLVYRSTGATNQKRRPPWFDKDACLASAVRASLEAGGTTDITFLNDGPIPHDRLRFMTAHGRIVSLDSVGNRGSYRTAISLPDQQSWPDHDLVYFCEDDYLHLPHAFSTLIEAVPQLGDVGFFNLYDHTDFYLPTYPRSTTLDIAGNHHWRTARDTCLTFGARVGALRSHRWLHYLGTIPNTPRDKRIWRATQREGLFRLLPSRRATRMASAVPALATHVEQDFMSYGVDWLDVHRDAVAWSRGQSAGELEAQ